MLQRREFMKVFSAAGVGGTLLPGVLWAQAQGKPVITKEMIDAAAKIAGVAIPDEYQKVMLETSMITLMALKKSFSCTYRIP